MSQRALRGITVALLLPLLVGKCVLGFQIISFLLTPTAPGRDPTPVRFIISSTLFLLFDAAVAIADVNIAYGLTRGWRPRGPFWIFSAIVSAGGTILLGVILIWGILALAFFGASDLKEQFIFYGCVEGIACAYGALLLITCRRDENEEAPAFPLET